MKRKITTKLLLLAGSLFLATSVFAQQRMLTGVVTDASNGNPLPGATVVVKGTTTGTAASANGVFQLKVSTGNTVTVSFIGYQATDILITDQTELEVALQPAAFAVDELVVIGYGTVKKSDATGSVNAISSKDFNKGAITSAQDLLIGKSAGVVITNSSGAPGAGATIRIRGGSSLNASNDPLIIIDGVPIDNSNVSGSSNFLSFVNPNDIESVTVLKDASATAIYGSRASNGVIIISTKKGKAGSKMKVSYDGYTSFSKAIKFVDVYSGDELRALAKDSLLLSNIKWKTELLDRVIANEGKANADTSFEVCGANTDWQQELFRTAITHDHNLSLSGSYKNLPYRVSVGYTSQQGIMKNTDMQRLTGAISLDPTFLQDDLKVSINLKGMNTDNNFGDYGALGSAVGMDPTKTIYDPDTSISKDGYFQWSNYNANLGTPNPVEQLMEADNKSNVMRYIGNIQVDYKFRFLPELRANLNIATDRTQSDGHNNRPVTSPSSLNGSYAGRLSDYNSTYTNDLFDFYLNYNKEISAINSRIDATAGYSYQHFQKEDFHYTRSFLDNNTPADSAFFPTENLVISFFGRLNYTYAGKYLLTFTLRDDGSSRFIDENRWGLFPSAAFAWKINEESFLKNSAVINELKLRLGWGVTGQQDIGSDYPAQAIYQQSSSGSYYPIGGVFLPTLRPNPYDPHIKWESTETRNVGLDFGIFKDRVSGAIDIYKRITSDLLNDVVVPTMSNFSNHLFTNVGSLQNKGVELSLNLVPISKKDMNLTFGFNLTYNENEVTKLLISDDPTYLGVLYGDAFTGQKQVSRVGYPVRSFFLNKQVYYPNGSPVEGLYVDLSGKGGTVNGINTNKYVYEKPAPDYQLGFSGRFNWKNFDASFSTRANIGNYVYNQVSAGASFDQMYQIGYWHNEPKYLNDTRFVKRQFTSDYFVTNASFLKLDNLSVGYSFENLFDKVGARISLTGQNLMTITKYEGIDPEVDGGIDNNFYPRPRTYLIGINLNF
jgi:TonB-dependent starch-binding outer membrane protein SusC